MTNEGDGDREFLMYLLIYSNKLAYLQPVTGFVYRSSPPKSHGQGYLNFSQKPWQIRVNDSFLEPATLLKII